MIITIQVGQCTIQQLKKLVEWLENSPLPLNPAEISTEVGIDNIRVQIKASKVLSNPVQPVPVKPNP